MTKDEAAGIVDLNKRGIPVLATELQTAISVLRRKRDSHMRLPALTEAARMKANLALIFNLWQASKVAA